MLARLIRWCVDNAAATLAVAAAVIIAGVAAIRETPLDALPDTSDAQVIVVTEWSGHSPDLVEDQITYPIVTSLLATPRVKTVRAVSDFGVSYVYVIFEDRTDLYWARARILEYLQGIRSVLPDDVAPVLGGDATGAGWVFEYALADSSGRHSLDELRSLQDWNIRYALQSVPGVADVAAIGGFTKQYQVTLDPNRLAAYRLSPKQIVDAIRASNNDAEGRLIEFSGREYMVRARGYLRSAADIEQVAVGSDASGTPIRVMDVARVAAGPDIRRGVAELDGRGEVVGGIVVMRFGANALAVADAVRAKVEEIRRTLPAGVEIVPTYDRSSVITGAIATLRRMLIEEMVVVALVVVAFLYDWRAAAVTLATIPVSVGAAFLLMWWTGTNANILSLSGIGLAIGVVVDASIVMVENSYRHRAAAGEGRATAAVVRATTEVGRPVFFSLAIILVSFLPIFLLEAQEGRLFRPLAMSKTLIISAATIRAFTIVPALMSVLMGGRHRPMPAESAVSRACRRLYEPSLRFVLRHPWASMAAAGALVPVAIVLAATLGREYMPPLYEGSLLYMPTTAPGLSAGEAARLVERQDQILRGIPEVHRVFGTAGRASTTTDNSPLNMMNTIVDLKPVDKWRRGLTLHALVEELDRKTRVAGLGNVWTSPIRGRLDMLHTGIRTPVGVKVLGADVATVDAVSREVEQALTSIDGTRSVYAERFVEGRFVDIAVDRAAIARYGLTVAEVEETVEIGVGGANITRTVEGRERYPVSVRYERDFRSDLSALSRVLVRTAAGAEVPLGQLASIEVKAGPSMIRDEGGQLAGYVYVDADSADLVGYVNRAQAAVGQRVKLPAGYRLEWSGEYELQRRAANRLRVVLPLVALLILFLLFVTFRAFGEAIIVMVSVVYAMTGGVVLQWLLGYPFSVAVWVGYIALYGVAVQTGVIMVVYLQEALDRHCREGRINGASDLTEAVIRGAVLRLRPKLMTVATTIVGLLPMLWSSGIGADLIRPIAAPIIGGMVTSAIHVLFVTPIIFFARNLPAARRSAQPSGSRIAQ